MTTSVSTSRVSVHETAKIAIIASLYVAVTLILAVISFGAVQLRLSEMFNYLALFHKCNCGNTRCYYCKSIFTDVVG